MVRFTLLSSLVLVFGSSGALAGDSTTTLRVNSFTNGSVVGKQTAALEAALAAAGAKRSGQFESSTLELSKIECERDLAASPGSRCRTTKDGQPLWLPFAQSRVFVDFFAKNRVPAVPTGRGMKWSFETLGCGRFGKGGPESNLTCYFSTSLLTSQQPGTAIFTGAAADHLYRALDAKFEGSDPQVGRRLKIDCSTSRCSLESFPLEISYGDDFALRAKASITGDAARSLFEHLDPDTSTEVRGTKQKIVSHPDGSLELTCTLEPFSNHCELSVTQFGRGR